ncbi:MAG TPA: hypothetical protein EYG85_07205 [Crocinitomix sp.]|nr:hypothetical protein [Crocinitomix sp.]
MCNDYSKYVQHTFKLNYFFYLTYFFTVFDESTCQCIKIVDSFCAQVVFYNLRF